VDLAFATSQVDPPDRLAAWRELVNRVFLPLAITPIAGQRDPGAFEASVTARTLGGMRVWRVTGSPMSAVRARRHIEASGHDDYLLALHIMGTAHGAQDGREVTLGPGDFALFDSARPYSVSFTGPRAFEHVIYQVPGPAWTPEATWAPPRRGASAPPAARGSWPRPICARWPIAGRPGRPGRRSSTRGWTWRSVRCARWRVTRSRATRP
jgi:hypothetical protein